MSDDVDGFGSRRGMQPFVDGFLRVVRDDLRSAKSNPGAGVNVKDF